MTINETAKSVESGEHLEVLSQNLIRSASRITRVSKLLPGVKHSAIAWRVLSDLDAGGAERVSTLTSQQRVAQPSMTALVQRLEGEGWVDRTADPADGRATLVSITDAGRDALARYRESLAALLTPHIEALEPSDRVVLARAVELMHHLADAT